MPWIESHTVLLRHRKLVGLASDLHLKPVHALGHLHALWHVVIEQQEDGDLSAWSDATVADAACFTGDASRFVALLSRHGWIDKGTRTIHDWLDYTSLYLTRKYAKRHRDKLVEIWAKYGKVYGEREVSNDCQTLVKQQSLSEGVGRSKDSSKMVGSDPPRWAYREWIFHLGRARNSADEDKFIDELYRQGYTDAVLIEAIQEPSRDRDQTPWEFKKWLKARGTPKLNAKRETSKELADFNTKQQELARGK